MNELQLRHNELADNPTPRVPVCLALDVSGSMAGTKINELNLAIRAFYQAIRDDEMARISAEIAIVTFGSNVKEVQDFSSIDRQSPPLLTPSGSTPMGEGVIKSLDLLEQAKRVYSKMGVDYYQPWLVLMTDGAPTDDIQAAITRCHDLIQRRKLTVFPIAIGAEANLSILQMFTPNLEPLRVQETDFKRFFTWLAKSVSVVSMSNPGDVSSASLGESAYKKMSADLHSQMMKGPR